MGGGARRAILACAVLFIGIGRMAHGGPVEAEKGAGAYRAIDVTPFADAVRHWQNKYGRDRNDARYAPEQIVEIGDNLLRYQNPDGGWPKDVDWLAIIEYEEVRRLRGHTLDRSTLDNRNTYGQIEYLAQVYEQTGFERFRAAAQRGLDFILSEQRPTGGWRGADVDAITFNDDVMTGVMGLLRDIRQGAAHFAWLSAESRERVEEALRKGIAATLACQIVVDGKKTGWCQQHDHATFAPVKARTYELPAICSAETVSVARFLMELPEPTPEVVAAIEGAVAWLEGVKIGGIRVERIPIEPVRFENHTAKEDVIVVSDPAARPVWARYYEIETNRPFFCNRDGRKVYSLAEVALERRTGYGWYGYWPAALLAEEYPVWKARIAKAEQP
jgi:PelA/Pel-15E family pectate lyase